MASESKKNLQVEFIKDFTSFLSYMPNPDEIMLRTGESIRLYDEMLTDGRISSLFYTRRNATLNLPIGIESIEDEQLGAFVHQYLKDKTLRKWAWKLLTGALQYGFRPMEIVWKRVDGYLVPDYLKGHHIERYSFTDTGVMQYTDAYGLHTLDQQYKWIVHRHEGDSRDLPTGHSILKSAYWPFKFKQLGWQFWVTATEKFSVPSLVALFESTGGDPDRVQQTADGLAELVLEVTSGSGGALGNVKDLKEISMSGVLKDFEVLINACDVQIAYALTGQSLATNTPGDTGSRAVATVHADTMADYVENDARALAYTLQDLVSMTIKLNFGVDALVPDLYIDTKGDAPWAQISDAIEKGIPVSKKALYGKYQIPEPDDEDDVFLVVQPSTLGVAPPVGPGGSEPGETGAQPTEGAAVDDQEAGVQLNGAQVSAAAGIVKAVEAGELPRDSGLAQLKILFNLSQDQAEEMMGSAGNNPKPKEFADQDPGKKKARRDLLIL